ncbi:exopolysaccharide biosynthesis protein [Geomonas sp. Red276]
MRVLILKFLLPLLSLAAFLEPYWGAVYYSFISVIRPEQLTYGNTAISGVFAAAISCLFLSCLIYKENLLAVLRQGFFQCFLVFLAALYVSTYMSPFTDFLAPKGSIYYLKQMPQVLVFCGCLYAILIRRGAAGFNLYLKLLVFFFLFMGLWGIDQHLRGNVLVERLFGSSITDRCAVTGIYILYLPLAVYLTRSRDVWTRSLGLLSVTVYLVMIVLTQSRAGFLGLCLATVLMFLRSNRKKRFILCGGLLLIAGAVWVPDGYLERMQQMKVQDVEDAELTDYSSASRQLLWQVALEMISDRPLLGVGNLNFSAASVEYSARFKEQTNSALYGYTFLKDGKSRLTHTHNTFLNLLVEGGMLSSLPYFFMLFMPFGRGRILNERYRGRPDDRLELFNLINCGLAGFLVTAFFSNMMLVDYFYWNLTLSCYLADRLENDCGEPGMAACPASPAYSEAPTP